MTESFHSDVCGRMRRHRQLLFRYGLSRIISIKVGYIRMTGSTRTWWCGGSLPGIARCALKKYPLQNDEYHRHTAAYKTDVQFGGAGGNHD